MDDPSPRVTERRADKKKLNVFLGATETYENHEFQFRN